MNLPVPRYRVGYVAPLPVQDFVGYTFYKLVPDNVMMASTSLGLQALTQDGVDQAMERFWRCVDLLAMKPVDIIVQAGVPLSAFKGRAFCDELLREIKARTGAQGLTDFHAVLQGMHHLGVQRVVVANKWDDVLNQHVQAFLESDGLEVVGFSAEAHSAAEVQQVETERGIQLALDLGRNAFRAYPEADGLFLAGGAWLSVHAIPQLEAEFGKPVFVNLQSTVWSALRTLGIWKPISGWGELLAST